MGRLLGGACADKVIADIAATNLFVNHRKDQAVSQDEQYDEGFAEGVAAGEDRAAVIEAHTQDEAAARLARQQRRLAADHAAGCEHEPSTVWVER